MSLEEKSSEIKERDASMLSTQIINTSKVSLSQKVNWRPSAEKETYHTVVVNYHFPNAFKNCKVNNEGYSKKIRGKKAKISNIFSFEDVPNLRMLFGEEDNLIESRIVSSTRIPEKENKELQVEVYCLPPQQKAKIFERKKETLRKFNEEVIVVNLNEDKVPQHCVSKTDCNCQLGISQSDPQSLSRKMQIPFNSENNLSSSSSKPFMSDKLLNTSLLQIQQNVQATNQTIKQRRQELHHCRIAFENKRMELLELKLERERNEMERDKLLFEKELEIKMVQIQQLRERQISRV